ncbi:MAG TPA: rhomboid family intramembrane serine protease, partial [Thermoanaerobaculia bacterium]|nr:rhomboid family intramembrane serine protease [Thermoanaerobaculia bacterium]
FLRSVGHNVSGYNHSTPMILIPIGRDDAEIRRHAWVSYVIIGLNILAFVITFAVERTYGADVNTKWRAAVSYFAQHPYLRMPHEMRDVLPEDLAKQLAMLPAERPASALAQQRQQEELEALTADAAAAVRQLPTMRLGYTPGQGSALTLLTSMFMHAGFLHLIGNLLFFYISGPFIEDLYGRPLFGILYFAGGIAATLTYGARHVADATPLVGASGAIAAVMGAYLVRLATSKIRFLFVPFLLRPTFHYVFAVPAFIVLPLWFVQQFWQMQSEHNAAVAFSAHVGGFVFGAAFAAIVKLTGFEEKYVAPKVEQQTSWKADPRILQAMDARSLGNLPAAKQTLAAVLRDDPKNVDAMRLAIDVAEDSDDATMLDSVASRLFAVLVEAKQHDEALTLLLELGTAPVPKLFARGAAFVERNGDREAAIDYYQRAIDRDKTNGVAQLQALMKMGTLLRIKGDTNGARSALTRAKMHPACTAEWAPTIDAKLEQLGGEETPWA